VSDDATFRQQLEDFAKMRDSLTEETAEDKLTPLYECVGKMPWNEDKDLLYRYLGDAKLIIGRDDAEADLYVSTVADLYEKAEEKSLAEIMNSQKKEVSQEDAMTEEEKKAEEAKKAQSDAESKEMDNFMTKVKDHIAGGGKISDWAVKGKKAEDEEVEETAEEKKKREDAEKAKKAEDDEAENAKKEEEEKAAEDAGPSLLGQYDSAPFNMSMDFTRRAPSSEAGLNLLDKLGLFGDSKEKK
jgi:hypothetical protein